MKHGSLFSGIGGFDLAAEWMGWENVFHCEWNEFGQKVLNYYWPNAKSYGDITKTDFTEWRGECDILTGGFPCQPYSTAGKRKGKEDDRHLWPEMLRAIREIQPTWIVGENVPGLLNWEKAAGFEVFPPLILPACGKNAVHLRNRLWIVAHANVTRKENNSRTDRITTENISGELFGNGMASDPIGERGCSRITQGEYAVNVNSSGQTNRFERNELGWPTEPSLCFTNDGVSERLVGETFSGLRRKANNALGNSIVPQIALEIFKAIEECNKTLL